ncbi:unnamed protein product [Danaus chrysippus]|uniref:(African queen) hypothetical protein n=1 Tax=Danaus chrysippus TaxID=151541 RepID=A0A8J2RJ63_9NEOP|nr:unnamed protein product [Danaus chrysippus]
MQNVACKRCYCLLKERIPLFWQPASPGLRDFAFHSTVDCEISLPGDEFNHACNWKNNEGWIGWSSVQYWRLSIVIVRSLGYHSQRRPTKRRRAVDALRSRHPHPARTGLTTDGSADGAVDTLDIDS